MRATVTVHMEMPRSPSNEATLCNFCFDSITENVYQSR